jgi:uncharacterized protein (TIGR03067 family)
MRTILPLTLVFAVLSGCQSPKNKDKRVEEELARIEGTWQQASGRATGAEIPRDLISDIRLLVKGDKKTVESIGQVIVRDVKIIIETGTNPEAWDEEPKSDSGKQLVIRGIYKLEGDTLTGCIASADKERPTEFDSRPGFGHTLQVFHRVKADGDR